MKSVLLAFIVMMPSLLSAAGAPSGTLGIDERKRAHKLTNLLIKEGRLKEAESWVRKNLAADSEKGEWILSLARILSETLDHKSAIGLYKKLLETRSDDPGLLFALGQQAVEAKEYDLAHEAFFKARELTGDPKAAYELAKVSFRRGNPLEGRKWAREALVDLEDPSDFEEKLLQLKLRSLFGNEDEYNAEFEALHSENPKETGILGDWADTMLEFDRMDEAEKPLALLKNEPTEELQWRVLEATRLRKLESFDALANHLKESMTRFPGESTFLLLRGDSERQRRCWACAEVFVSSAMAYFDKEREAKRVLLNIRDKGHHWIGPTYEWLDSQSANLLYFGFGYRGLPRPHIRVTAEPGIANFKRKDGSSKGTAEGIMGTVSLERARWIAGLSGDLRHTEGLTTASPGAFLYWDPADRWSFRLRTHARRLSIDNVGELAAGVQTDQVRGTIRFTPWRPVTLKLSGRTEHLTARAGGKADQNYLVPGFSWRVFEKKLYLALGYDYYHLNGSADADFRRVVGITSRARTHIGTLSASKYFLNGHLRPDAYIFSAEDADRGRGFFSGNYVGFGLGIEYFVGRWKLSAGYSQTREDLDGIGERSQRVRARIEWRWGPSYGCHQEKRRPRHGR